MQYLVHLSFLNFEFSPDTFFPVESRFTTKIISYILIQCEFD